ncbi:MAG: 4a-hydroxytetrahydrobiopterin dehydratase [Anaerolineales bacterium]
MKALAELKCVPCRGEMPALTASEVAALLPAIPAWQVVKVADIPRLERTFSFKDFAAALAFVNQVGVLAEAEDHHPSICLTWGQVKVQWWTYVIEGLHRNDFIMAAKTDLLV